MTWLTKRRVERQSLSVYSHLTQASFVHRHYASLLNSCLLKRESKREGEADELFKQNLKRERVEGRMWVSEQAKEREGVLLPSPSNGWQWLSTACCFMSLSVTHSLSPLARLPVGPYSVFWHFPPPQMVLFASFLWDEGCFSRISKKNKKKQNT